MIIGNCEFSTLQCVLPAKGGGCQSANPDREKFAKRRGKSGKTRKIWKKRQKLGRLLTSPLLADRAGYATGPIEGFGNPDLFTFIDYRKSG